MKQAISTIYDADSVEYPRANISVTPPTTEEIDSLVIPTINAIPAGTDEDYWSFGAARCA